MKKQFKFLFLLIGLIVSILSVACQPQASKNSVNPIDDFNNSNSNDLTEKNEKLIENKKPNDFKDLPNDQTNENENSKPDNLDKKNDLQKQINLEKAEKNKLIISQNGGNFEGLKTDKYLEIVKNLSLNKTTLISKLTNDKLNDLIKNKFKNLKLSLANGTDDGNGTLKLNLESTNNKINPTIITITGFDPITNTGINISTSITLNYEKYFSDFQMQKEFVKFRSDQIKKYFNFKLQKNGHQLDDLN